MPSRPRSLRLPSVPSALLVAIAAAWLFGSAAVLAPVEPPRLATSVTLVEAHRAEQRDRVLREADRSTPVSRGHGELEERYALPERRPLVEVYRYLDLDIDLGVPEFADTGKTWQEWQEVMDLKSENHEFAKEKYEKWVAEFAADGSQENLENLEFWENIMLNRQEDYLRARAKKWRQKLIDAQEMVDYYKSLPQTEENYALLVEWLDKRASRNVNLKIAEADLEDFLESLTQTPAGEGGGIAVPVVVSEALPAGVAGVDRDGAVATFGLPFAPDAGVFDVGGVPSLGVLGTDRWQARTLDTWPDGSVRWALIDMLTDVDAGQSTEGFVVTLGEGTSPQADVASIDGNTITLDTGVLQATVRTDAFNVLDTVVVDDVPLVLAGTSPGVVARRPDGALLLASDDTEVSLEENGPVRAVVRADGSLVSGEGTPHIDFTCRVIARWNSRDVEVRLTVRNASLARPQHTEVSGIEVALRVEPGPNRVATYPGYEQQTSFSVGPFDTSYLYQAQTSAPIEGLESQNYLPHIPKTDTNPFDLTEQGYKIVRNGITQVPFSSVDEYPTEGWGHLAGDDGGIVVALQHMSRSWPAAIELWGDGTVSAGLFTQRNAVDYVFVWRQHESRTAVFSFHSNDQAATPDAVARRLDNPVSARAAEYQYYDDAGVFPYRLVTVAEHDAAYEAMGIDWNVALDNEEFHFYRYLAAASVGGVNNHANIERRLATAWLRHGLGGQYQVALANALYKSEWQIERSDDFHHLDDPGASNDVAPGGTPFYSRYFQGDLEHKYREGIILAYHLTGDERYREALLDEVEVITDVYLAPNSRAMAQTLRALALLAEFTDDPVMHEELRERVDFITLPVLSSPGVTPWGWDGPPGLGPRGYFAYDQQTPEKYSFDPVPAYATKGFFEASLLPIAYYHASRVLGTDDLSGENARLRMLDLARYTRNELLPAPEDGNPEHRLAYVYDILGQKVLSYESYFFHPVLLGLAEAYLATGDVSYLEKGVEQIDGFDNGYAPNMEMLDTRLDVQHFMDVYLEAVGASAGS